MSTCMACTTGLQPEDQYCNQCGIANGPGGWVVGLLPAVSTGFLVAAAGMAVVRLLPQSGGTGFFGEIISFTLTSTIPHLDVGLGFFGGWAAAIATEPRTWRRAAAAGLGVGLLYTLTLLALVQASSGFVMPMDRLGLALGLALVGALSAVLLAHRLGEVTRVGSILRALPGGPLLRAGLGTLFSVAGLIVLFGIAITALIVAVTLLILYVAVRVAFALFGWSLGSGDRSSGVKPTDFVDVEGATQRENERRAREAEAEYGRQQAALFAAAGGRGALLHRSGTGPDANMDRDGVVHADGRVMGSMGDKGIVSDLYGDSIGKVDEHGLIFDRSGKHIGRVDDHGVITDASGRVVGSSK